MLGRLCVHVHVGVCVCVCVCKKRKKRVGMKWALSFNGEETMIMLSIGDIVCVFVCVCVCALYTVHVNLYMCVSYIHVYYPVL